MAEYIKLLQCGLVRAEFNFSFRMAVLYLPEDNCCDMYGAIKFSQKVLPKVDRINVYSGAYLDMRYTRHTDGYWRAVDERHASGNRRSARPNPSLRIVSSSENSDA